MQAATPDLSIIGATGIPGGTVSVTLALAGDDEKNGVSADADIRFPTDQLEFFPPVAANCRVDDHIAATHQIGGTLSEAGLLSLAIFVRNLQVVPLGDGVLATCDFHILSTAALGSAPLHFDFVDLGDSNGLDLPVSGLDGAVTIGQARPACACDCDASGMVTVDELIRGVRIVLGEIELNACAAADTDGDGLSSIAELIQGVNATLLGCPGIVVLH